MVSNRSGKVVYIMGASGSGKDTLITHVRACVEPKHNVVFAHRYITRPVEADGENHIALSQEEFDHREQNQCFAMSWRAHRNGYGVGVEIDHWLNAGMTVVVNGSRGYLENARKDYPELEAVLISVSSENLKNRLRARARETEEAIEQRLARTAQFSLEQQRNTHVIDNNAELGQAGRQLCQYLLRA